MKEDFRGDITDFITRAKETLQKMHPSRAKKMIFNIENNLKSFSKYQTKIKIEIKGPVKHHFKDQAIDR